MPFFLIFVGLVGVHEARRVVQHFGYRLFLTPVLLTIFVGIGGLHISWFRMEWLAFTAVALSALLAMIPPADLKKSLPNTGVTITVSAYLGFALIALGALFQVEGTLLSGYDTGRTLIAFAIVMVWAGDTSAYLVGSLIGKHKIAPNVSPNKSYEGAFANLAGNFAFALIAQKTFLTELNNLDLLVLTLVFGILGFYGDLVESCWKRGSGIKDSGSLLPGHGGILDCLDSIFLTAPIFYVYMTQVVLLRTS